MKNLMQCSLCDEPIIRDHEGQVVVVRNKLVVLSGRGVVRVKCPRCGKLQVVDSALVNQVCGQDGALRQDRPQTPPIRDTG